MGSKLIEKGKVYRVFKIKKIKNDNGEEDRLLYYRPYFKDSTNRSLVCSIPESSLKEANIRRPISKDEAKDVLNMLSRRTRNPQEVDTVKDKEILKKNDIGKSSRILRRYWKAQKKDIESFTKNKRDVLGIAVDRIVEEIAVVYGTSLDTARMKIESALQK